MTDYERKVMAISHIDHLCPGERIKENVKRKKINKTATVYIFDVSTANVPHPKEGVLCIIYEHPVCHFFHVHT